MREPAGRYSIRMPVLLMTLAQRSISAREQAASSSALEPAGSNPAAMSRSRDSGVCRILIDSAFKRAMMSFVAPTGVTMPNQVVAS